VTSWVYDDGGRAAAGFRGKAGDCAVRALTIASRWPYTQVYDMVNAWGLRERASKRRRAKSSARTGVYGTTMRRILDALGWPWTPTMGIGTGCRVHLLSDELPRGRLVVVLSKHYAAVIDGEVRDTHDPSREGTRCVYGYWTCPETR